jgi:hypothetical protein
MEETLDASLRRRSIDGVREYERETKEREKAGIYKYAIMISWRYHPTSGTGAKA